MSSPAVRKIAVYIATTGGPVRVERITEEPAPQSVVCLRRSSEVLPISGDYDDFVRPGSGVIVREFGPFENNAFRLDLSGAISAGKSWQLGVFVAHAVETADGYALARSDEEADEIFWLTGTVDYDLQVGEINHVAEKLEASRPFFEQWASANKKVSLGLAKGANFEEAKALTSARLAALETAMDLLTRTGIYSSASSSEVLKLDPIPTSPAVEGRRKGDSSPLWILALVVLAALGFLAYYTVPDLIAHKGSPPVSSKQEIANVKLPPPPMDKTATSPPKTSPKPVRKGAEKKIFELVEELLRGIQRSKAALEQKGDDYQYGSPPRLVLLPTGFKETILNPRAAQKMTDRLVAALLETSAGNFTFLARDDLSAIIADLEATGALDQNDGDPIADLLENAGDVDILIKGTAFTDGNGSQISFKAMRKDGVLMAQTEPRRFKIKLRPKQNTGEKKHGKSTTPSFHLRADREIYRLGEKLNLKLKLAQDAWVYCFYEQANGEIVQIFPNPPYWEKHAEPKLLAGRAYTIPGETTFPFDLIVSPPTGQEHITCYATDKNVTGSLPGELQGRTLDPLRSHTAAGIEAVFGSLPGIKVARSGLEITIKN